MRAFSADFRAGTAGDYTYLGWLLSITPVGLAPVYLNTIGVDYTDSADSPPVTYRGDPGFVMGNVRVTDGTDPATLDIEIPVSEDGPVTPDDVTRGLYIGATVVVRIVDYENGEASPPVGYTWSVGRTRITDDGQAAFELRADTRINRELLLKVIGPQCSANLGDDRCGVDMTSFTNTVEVASVTSLYEFTITGASARANGFFDNGAIKFTSGGNINRAYTVRKWTQSTGQVLLWEPLRTPVAIGDDATVHAGCDKSRGAAGCTKFSNIARFQGFADLPPEDAVFRNETSDGGTVDQPSVVTDPEPPQSQRGPFSAGYSSGGFIG